MKDLWTRCNYKLKDLWTRCLDDEDFCINEASEDNKVSVLQRWEYFVMKHQRTIKSQSCRDGSTSYACNRGVVVSKLLTAANGSVRLTCGWINSRGIYVKAWFRCCGPFISSLRSTDIWTGRGEELGECECCYW